MNTPRIQFKNLIVSVFFCTGFRKRSIIHAGHMTINDFYSSFISALHGVVLTYEVTTFPVGGPYSAEGILFCSSNLLI